MVDNVTLYKEILERAVRAYDGIIELYTPDIRNGNDFAARTVAQAISKRDGLLERLNDVSHLVDVFKSNYSLSIQFFIDEHWDDYREFPISDPTKFKRREALHAELLSVTKDIGQVRRGLVSKN